MITPETFYTIIPTGIIQVVGYQLPINCSCNLNCKYVFFFDICHTDSPISELGNHINFKNKQ